MKNEYLFLSREHRQELEKYKPNNVTKKILEINDTDSWIASFFIETNNKKSAFLLSGIHEYLTRYSPLVLSCESAEYFNKILYPYINQFERKLRELVYLAISISKNDKAFDDIGYLEDRDLGKIFDLLFIDQHFISELKIRVNNSQKSNSPHLGDNYSKSEIRDFINGLEENTRWDKYLGKSTAPILREHFRDLQTYRNHVMHAHNISNAEYEKILLLIKKVNNELDKKIVNLRVDVKDNDELSKYYEFSNSISNALNIEFSSKNPFNFTIDENTSKALAHLSKLIIESQYKMQEDYNEAYNTIKRLLNSNQLNQQKDDTPSNDNNKDDDSD